VKLNVTIPHALDMPSLSQPWERLLDGPEVLQAMRFADSLCYHKAVLGEHYVVPKEHLELSGAFWHQGTTALSAVAGCTQSIRLGSSIALLPLQNPIIQAKAWSTLDWFSNGRAAPVFGAGWLKGEFDLLRVPFHERGAMCDEFVQAMIALWTEESPAFQGKYISFTDVGFAPKPVQAHLPIWFGGDSESPWKRIAKWGDGWQPAFTKPERFPAVMDFIRSQPEYDGRALGLFFPIEAMRVGEGHIETHAQDTEGSWNAQEMIDLCGMLARLGVTETVIPLPHLRDFEEYLDRLRWVAEEIMPKVA